MTEACTLEFQFSSAHLYHQKNWSAEKNQKEFGKCFTEHGHGHNYRLELTIPMALESVEALKIKNEITRIVETLDHQHLNFTIPEFKETIPTSENIARYIYGKFSKPIPDGTELRLYEMDNLWVTIQK